MSHNKYQFLLLTGEPGVGKTTLIKKLCASLTGLGVTVEGIYTEERRGAGAGRGGGREGFDVVSLGVAGKRGVLATDTAKLSQPPRWRVGKYGVMLSEFEAVAIPALSKPCPQDANVLVIDEIGKMELFSAKFRSRIQEIFNPESEQVVLATVPSKKSDPFVEIVRNNSRSKVFEVRRDNRNTIHEDIMQYLEAALQLR